MPDRLLKVDEARALLTCGRERIYEYLNSGELPSVKLGPKSRRIRESDLERFIRDLAGDPPDGGKVAS